MPKPTKRRLGKKQILGPVVEETCMSTQFSHIFAGGYSAGYYSYKWAEVLDADAFSLFKQRGIFNPEVADSFRRNILSKGGTEHPMTLYKRFRGQRTDHRCTINQKRNKEMKKENKYKINRLCRPDDADHVTWFQCLQQRRRRNGNLQRQDLETEPHNY